MPANEWLTVIASEVANHAEVPQIGGLTRGPGIFALMDQDETTRLLDAAGFTDITFEPPAPTILIGEAPRSRSRWTSGSGMGMARGLIGLADTDARDKVGEAVGLSLTKR